MCSGGSVTSRAANTGLSRKSNITLHKANVHNIGVQWKQCPVCDYKAKKNDHLKTHIKRKHTSK